MQFASLRGILKVVDEKKSVMIGRWYLCKGERVQVIVKWNGVGPRNVAVRTEDGAVFVRPFRGLRKEKSNG